MSSIRMIAALAVLVTALCGRLLPTAPRIGFNGRQMTMVVSYAAGGA